MSYHHRTIRIFPFLAAMFLLLTTGCIKSEIPIAPPPTTPPPTTPPPGTPPPSGTFSATLGSTAWTAKYYTAYYYQYQQLYQFAGVAAGTNGDSTYLEVTFRPPLNQVISSYNGPFDVYYDDLVGNFDWDAGNSTGAGISYLQITAYDSASHTIAGSFYGSMNNTLPNAGYSDTLAIKNGLFNVTYTLQP